MAELRQGNVIRCPNGMMWIVTEVDDKTVKAVAFDAENCSAGQPLEDKYYTAGCECEGTDNYCPNCSGTGSYKKLQKGWKRSKVLAPNVKAFIERKFKKMMDI